MFEELRGLGYEGGYDSVRRYAKAWRVARGAATAEAYVPLSFAPGEAYQFDWSHEVVLINGMTVTVKVAHVRLCHSRMLFVRAYPRETQEMVFDAHARAFAFFKGTCTRGIYDNMKTAVEAVFIGKDRQYNRRFLRMCTALRRPRDVPRSRGHPGPLRGRRDRRAVCLVEPRRVGRVRVEPVAQHRPVAGRERRRPDRGRPAQGTQRQSSPVPRRGTRRAELGRLRASRAVTGAGLR